MQKLLAHYLLVFLDKNVSYTNKAVKRAFIIKGFVLIS